MVTDYTLAQLITDAYRRRYATSDVAASADERANIIRSAETHARNVWRQYNWFFAIETSTAVVGALGALTLPVNCSDLLLLTDGSGNEVGYTQRDTPSEVTVLDTNLIGDTLTLEFRTNEPTYVVGTETTTISAPMYEFLVFACVAELWGGDQQYQKHGYWMKEAYKCLQVSLDVIERQRGLKRRPRQRNYRRGR